jgi:transcriptional regulator with XRE-family HTH domain
MEAVFMGIEMLGSVIAKLRKDKGVTQEELAKAAGVSTQAVSKWENGGLPDSELLPSIADFFGVSIDTLFGRNIAAYGDIDSALERKIVESEPKERFKAAMDMCWVIHKALFGDIASGPSDYASRLNELDNQKRKEMFSAFCHDDGFSLLNISRNLPYFFLVPECSDKQMFFKQTDVNYEALYHDYPNTPDAITPEISAKYIETTEINYVSLFKDFSDQAVFDSMVLLYSRDTGKAFTSNLLVKNLNIDNEKAVEVIKTLQKYEVINTTPLEMDDMIQEVYTLNPDPAFIMLLIAARKLLAPKVYYYYCDSRRKPYLA